MNAKTLTIVVIMMLSITFPPLRGKAEDSKKPSAATDPTRMARFEATLDRLRQELKIPGMSAAIVKDQKVIWSKGFGFADLEEKIPATPHTPYHLASLTKTFASTILMQLLQEGKISLDDPVSKYGITLESEGVIRVRHLFSHTSEGKPGEQYRYNGNRFGELDKVIMKATGRSFAELLIENILDPLEMSETAPNLGPVAHTVSPAGTDPKAEADVKAALSDLIEGLNTGDAPRIERRLASGHNGFRAGGRRLSPYVDIPQARNDFKAGVKLDFQTYDVEAAVYGPTALTTFIMSGVVTLPNGTRRNEGPSRTSLFWRNEGGFWKVVHGHESPLTEGMVTDRHRQRFELISKSLAKPYRLDGAFNIERFTYPTHFSTSAGLISSVLDMAKYDIAIDRNRFLERETQQLAFTPTVSTNGRALPYGLGWFTQNYRGTRMIWHYGYWTCNSSLILKVPDRNITFIAMANTDNLSRPTDLGAGDVMSSPVGMAFLKSFVFPEIFGQEIPELDWQAPSDELMAEMKRAASKPYAEIYSKELVNRARLNNSVGRTAESPRLFKIFAALFAKALPDDLSKKTALAEIKGVGNNANHTVEFSLPRDGKVRVFTIGEGQAGQMFDHGWIESAQTGKPVWETREAETGHAGGAGKNRILDTVVTLPAGNYRLRYKSDDSHSFDNWNSAPPSVNFWGIAIYASEG